MSTHTRKHAIAYLTCSNGHNWKMEMIHPVEVNGYIDGLLGSSADVCETCEILGAEHETEVLAASWSEADVHGNRSALEGCSRCECGCKYWENDRCTDCGTAHDAARHDKEN